MLYMLTLQNKLKRRMSHLTVVAEVPTPEPDAGEISEEADEEYPLLGRSRESHAPRKKLDEVILTETFTLLPDFTLSYQVQRHRTVHFLSVVMISVLIINNTVARGSRNH